jgi:cardiolipin synthase
VNRKRWPNLISATRIALMPAVLASAITGSRIWFVVLITISLTTDALDGFLARRFNALSEFGRKLDSAADYVTMLAGVGGIALLWPEIVRRELPWIVTGLVAFFAVIVYSFIRFGHAPCYHTWASKTGAVVCPFTLVPLLNEWSAAPFHAVIVWLVLTGVEEIAIALIVPSHVGEMPTVWHARRRRREAGAQANPSQGYETRGK